MRNNWIVGLWNGHALIKAFDTEEEYLKWCK
jgi:hypothetical protein